MKRVVSIDPSGNWTEGKGTTGLAMYENGKLVNFTDVKAKEFTSAEQFWGAVEGEIYFYSPNIIVCESFRLQPGKAAAQSWSAMETPMLIGYLKMQAWKNNCLFILQDASCKARVPDDLLVKMGMLQRRGDRYYALDRATNDHIRDAIRHGVYYHLYGERRNE